MGRLRDNQNFGAKKLSAKNFIVAKNNFIQALIVIENHIDNKNVKEFKFAVSDFHSRGSNT